MPAAVFWTDAAVVRRVLVPVDGFTPGAADEWRIQQKIYLLAVVEGLGVEVSITCVVVRFHITLGYNIVL